MFYRLIISVMFLCAVALSGAAQNSDPGLPGGLEESLRRGDVPALESHINSTLELILPQSRGVYERPHALQILKKFMADNPVLEFVVTYRMPRGEGYYAIGRLYTHKGNYRIILWLKMNGEKLTIHQFRIEEDNE